jgi:hypothetical protein
MDETAEIKSLRPSGHGIHDHVYSNTIRKQLGFPIQKKERKTTISNCINIFCESNTIGQVKEFCDSSRQDFDTLDDQEKDGRICLEQTN